MDPVQKALWGGIFPAALGALAAGLTLLAASRGIGGRRLAAWSVPLAGIAAMLASYFMQFEESSGRWRGILWAVAAILVVWPILLTPRVERWRSVVALTLVAALVLAAVAGAAMWGTFYESQPTWQRWIPVVATAVLVVGLYPLAIRLAMASDGLAVALAGAILTPVVVFSGNATFAELLVAPVVSAGVASLMALFLNGERWEEWRRGICAGAIGLALIYPCFAVLAWGNSYDLPDSHAWALALPCVAVLLTWTARIPGLSRKTIVAGVIAVSCVVAVAGAGFGLAFREADTAAYDPGF